MSYILEALRKSEQQRREIEEQPLARLTAAPPRERSRWRLAMLYLSALTNVAVLVYLLAPHVVSKPLSSFRDEVKGGRPNEAVADPQESPATERQRLAPADVASAPVTPRPDSAPPTPAKPVPPSVSPSAGAKPALPNRPAKEARRQRTTVVPTERRFEPAPELVESVSRGDAREQPQVPVRPAPEPAEPPDGVPRPKINVYAYSARVDGDRFVIIHNRKYREGDRIEGGPVVRRIEEHGMTLELAGQTYKIPRP